MDNLANVTERTQRVAFILFSDTDTHITGGLDFSPETLTENADALFGASMMAAAGSDDDHWLSYLQETAHALALDARLRQRQPSRHGFGQALTARARTTPPGAAQ